MTYISIILILISALIHAGWNLQLKKENTNSITFVLQFSFFSAVLCIPVLLVLNHWFFLMPVSALLLACISGMFLAIYSYTLNKAYHYGEISFAYPIIRSLPIIIVMTLTCIFAFGKPLSLYSIIGMAIIISGCFILPTVSFKNFKLKNYLNIVCFFSVISALGTTGYSITDKIAIDIINNSPVFKNSLVKPTMVYNSLEFLSAFIWIFIFIFVSNPGLLKETLHKNLKLKSAAIVGTGSILGYFLVLLAMSFVTNVSYVVAFRQLSIPLGAILGIIIFKEQLYVNKLIGILIIFLGLVVVAVF